MFIWSIRFQLLWEEPLWWKQATWKEIQVKDLDIPAGFQWKLTQVAAGTVAATTPTMVSFFLDEACSKEEKIADIPVDTEISSLPLSIPTYVNTLYAQYKTSTNETKK